MSEASFDELQARFNRASGIADVKPGKRTISIDKLLEFLRSREAKIKPRDLHEVEALAAIVEARSAEEVLISRSTDLPSYIRPPQGGGGRHSL